MVTYEEAQQQLAQQRSQVEAARYPELTAQQRSQATPTSQYRRQAAMAQFEQQKSDALQNIQQQQQQINTQQQQYQEQVNKIQAEQDAYNKKSQTYSEAVRIARLMFDGKPFAGEGYPREVRDLALKIYKDGSRSKSNVVFINGQGYSVPPEKQADFIKKMEKQLADKPKFDIEYQGISSPEYPTPSASQLVPGIEKQQLFAAGFSPKDINPLGGAPEKTQVQKATDAMFEAYSKTPSGIIGSAIGLDKLGSAVGQTVVKISQPVASYTPERMPDTSNLGSGAQLGATRFVTGVGQLGVGVGSLLVNPRKGVSAIATGVIQETGSIVGRASAQRQTVFPKSMIGLGPKSATALFVPVALVEKVVTEPIIRDSMDSSGKIIPSRILPSTVAFGTEQALNIITFKKALSVLKGEGILGTSGSTAFRTGRVPVVLGEGEVLRAGTLLKAPGKISVVTVTGSARSKAVGELKYNLNTAEKNLLKNVQASSSRVYLASQEGSPSKMIVFETGKLKGTGGDIMVGDRSLIGFATSGSGKRVQTTISLSTLKEKSTQKATDIISRTFMEQRSTRPTWFGRVKENAPQRSIYAGVEQIETTGVTKYPVKVKIDATLPGPPGKRLVPRTYKNQEVPTVGFITTEKGTSQIVLDRVLNGLGKSRATSERIFTDLMRTREAGVYKPGIFGPKLDKIELFKRSNVQDPFFKAMNIPKGSKVEIYKSIRDLNPKSAKAVIDVRQKIPEGFKRTISKDVRYNEIGRIIEPGAKTISPEDVFVKKMPRSEAKKLSKAFDKYNLAAKEREWDIMLAKARKMTEERQKLKDLITGQKATKQISPAEFAFQKSEYYGKGLYEKSTGGGLASDLIKTPINTQDMNKIAQSVVEINPKQVSIPALGTVRDIASKAFAIQAPQSVSALSIVAPSSISLADSSKSLYVQPVKDISKIVVKSSQIEVAVPREFITEKTIQVPREQIITRTIQTPRMNLALRTIQVPRQQLTPREAFVTRTTLNPNTPTYPKPRIPMGSTEVPESRKIRLSVKKRITAFVPELRRRGVYKQIGGITTKGRALRLGELAARRTLGATFRARPVVITAEEELKDINYKVSSTLFRAPKRKGELPLTFVQRQKARLVSRPEIREIVLSRGAKSNAVKFTGARRLQFFQ